MVCQNQVGNIEILIPPLSSHTRGDHHRFLQPHSRIDSHLYSFFPSAIRPWNNLPNDITESSNFIYRFRQLL